MTEDISTRGQYPLVPVKSLNYGNDGIARFAVIRPATGEYTRLIVELALFLAPLGAEYVSAANYASVL